MQDSATSTASSSLHSTPTTAFTTSPAKSELLTEDLGPSDAYFSSRELTGEGGLTNWELLKLRLEILNKLPNQTIMDYLRNKLSNEELLKLLPSNILDEKTMEYNELKSKLQESLEFGKEFAPLIEEFEQRLKSNLSPLAKATGFDELYSKLLDSFGMYSDNVNRHLAELKQEFEALDLPKEFSPLLKAMEDRLTDEISLLATVVLKIKEDLSEIKKNEEMTKTNIQNAFNDFMDKFLASRKSVDGTVDAIYKSVSKLDCTPRSQIVSLNGNLSTGFSIIETQLSKLIEIKEELWSGPCNCIDQDGLSDILEMIEVSSNARLQNDTALCPINESPKSLSLTEDGLVKLCIFILAFGQLLSWFSKIVRYASIANLHIHLTTNILQSNHWYPRSITTNFNVYFIVFLFSKIQAVH